jgi:hypothetical protein
MNQQYVAVSCEDGASGFSVIVQNDEVPNVLHSVFCSCALDWKDCLTEGVFSLVEQIVCNEQWATNENCPSFVENYEDGVVTLIKLYHHNKSPIYLEGFRKGQESMKSRIVNELKWWNISVNVEKFRILENEDDL